MAQMVERLVQTKNGRKERKVTKQLFIPKEEILFSLFLFFGWKIEG